MGAFQTVLCFLRSTADAVHLTSSKTGVAQSSNPHAHNAPTAAQSLGCTAIDETFSPSLGQSGLPMLGGVTGHRAGDDGCAAHLAAGAAWRGGHQPPAAGALRTVGLSDGRGAGLQHCPVSAPSFCSLVFPIPGLSDPWSFCSLVFLFLGLSAPWSFCSLVFLLPGVSTPWSVCFLVFLFFHLSVPWSFCSLVFPHPGLFASWSFRSMSFLLSCLSAP